ncbi:hypothetical protein EBT16_08530 [bacterium]|nr:hypothetical protein [bacterium]
MFIVSSSAPADKSPQITEVIGVDGTVTSGYVRNAPTLPINLPSGSPLSTSAFKVTVGGDSGTIRFKVATNDGSFSTCTAQGIMESAVDVKGNFSGEFPGTREDHFYFVPNPSGSKDIKVDYVDRVGRYSTLILGITIPNADLPERMYAGDIDGDLKDDVILFKAGSFRWMQSKGNNGFEAPQAITGGWSAARIMTSVYFVPAANGVGARLQGFINGAPYRSFISRDGVTEPEPSPGEVFLALNSVVQSGGTYTANLTWSGANVRDCELLKCDLPEGATTCTPNLLVRSLALNENTIQGTGLTATQALAVRCFQLNNSGPLLTNPPVLVKVPNTCNVTNLVLSATKTNASLGLNNLTLPSLSFPADTQSVDIRLSSMIVDDNSPNITINGRQAYQLNEVETLTGLRTLPNLSYPITGFVNPGVNDLKCSVRNASGTSSSCSITLNGSYKTYGSCPADPRLSQVIGYFEGISAKKLTGYACETFSSRSITVKVYLGAPPGTSGSTLIGDFVANAASAGPVQQICSSTGTAHRFSIDLTSWIPLHKGKLIYLVGIHSNAALNAQLGNSGIVKVPNQ